MKTLLWLDDIRDPFADECHWLQGWAPEYVENIHLVHWAKTYRDFVEWIEENGVPGIVGFDHDLGDNMTLRGSVDVEKWFDIENNREYDGYDCAKWLVEHCVDTKQKLPVYFIQSANPTGRVDIDSYLINAKKHIDGI